MNRFTTPAWVKASLAFYRKFDEIPAHEIEVLRGKLTKFRVAEPEVSIVIPAWNEEENLAATLVSLAGQNISVPTELIIVNNNSTDSTQHILDTLGVQSYFQPVQGISITRQLGLEKAKGKIILSADADSLYPPDWAQLFYHHMQKSEVSVVYGRYSFLADENNPRFILGLYEILAEFMFTIRRKQKDCVNVMGFDFAYRKEEALACEGFNPHRSKWEDGRMAMKISAKFGSIYLEKSGKARVWTSNRRLMADGSLWKAFVRRVKKELRYFPELVFPKIYKPLAKDILPK